MNEFAELRLKSMNDFEAAYDIMLGTGLATEVHTEVCFPSARRLALPILLQPNYIAMSW